jgi:hypothetical protein
MTIPKLLALLQLNCLFFTRLDMLGDQFEGTLPIRNVLMRQGEGRSLDDQRVIRDHTLVSCWHLSRHESDALWQVYGRSDAPVAIRTTAQRLFDSFRTAEYPVYVGMVYYTDFNYGAIEPSYERFTYLFKRSSFQHEREVRAIIRVSTPARAGRNVAVDVSTLIDQVYVPASAPDWMMHVIAELLEKYEIPRPVKRSREMPHEY